MRRINCGGWLYDNVLRANFAIARASWSQKLSYSARAWIGRRCKENSREISLSARKETKGGGARVAGKLNIKDSRPRRNSTLRYPGEIFFSETRFLTALLVEVLSFHSLLRWIRKIGISRKRRYTSIVRAFWRYAYFSLRRKIDLNTWKYRADVKLRGEFVHKNHFR